MIRRTGYATRILTLVGVLLVGAVLHRDGVADDSPYPIAGVTPHERPAGAPTIDTFEKDAGWYNQALIGLTQPFPQSFQFLENQEAWYTPFNRPGMTGPYDIRGWHGDSKRSVR